MIIKIKLYKENIWALKKKSLYNRINEKNIDIKKI